MKRSFLLIIFMVIAFLAFLPPGMALAQINDELNIGAMLSVSPVPAPMWSMESSLSKHIYEVRTVAAPFYKTPEVVSVLKCPLVGIDSINYDMINTASGAIAPHPKFIT